MRFLRFAGFVKIGTSAKALLLVKIVMIITIRNATKIQMEFK